MSNLLNSIKINVDLLGLLIVCGACYGAGELRHIWWPGTVVILAAGLAFGYGMHKAGK